MKVAERLGSRIDVLPDRPKEGVVFYDVDPLLGDPEMFREVIELMAEPLRGKVDKLACFDARGFLFGPALAQELNIGFTMLRKPGKLMDEVVSESYDTEYSSDTIELQKKSILPGQRIELVDDVIATGGTALAGARLIRQLGAEVGGITCLLNLPALGGSTLLEVAGVEVNQVIDIKEQK